MAKTTDKKQAEETKGKSLSDQECARCRNVLEAQKKKGTYPMTVATLLAEAKIDWPGANAIVGRATAGYFHTSAAKDATSERVRSSLAFLPDDLETVAGSFETLRMLITTRTAGSQTQAHTVAQVTEKGHSGRFLDAVKTRVNGDLSHRRLPPGIGALNIRGHAMLFLFEEIVGTPKTAGTAAGVVEPPKPTNAVKQPGAPLLAEPVDLARRILEAFDLIDARTGLDNQVFLSDLRKEVGGAREAFDAAIDELRRSVTLTLSVHEGRFDQLTAEQREGGIQGPHSLLVYAARR
jgi:hypothetical protein